MRYKIIEPQRKNKKYSVLAYNPKTKEYEYLLSFGQLPYQHYKDTTPLKLYTNLNHHDKERRRLYYARHGKAQKYSAKWFSHKYLW